MRELEEPIGVPGLKGIALFEAAKGTLVIAAGFGLLSILHKDAQSVAAQLLRHLHLNPAKHYPHIFLQAASHVRDSNLLVLAAGAFVYSALRYVEAYGLWRNRAWAQWVAILSGAVYVPFEVIGLQKGVTPLRLALLAINVAIVLYVGAVRYSEERVRRSRGIE